MELRDTELGGWDIFEDNAYETVVVAMVTGTGVINTRVDSILTKA